MKARGGHERKGQFRRRTVSQLVTSQDVQSHATYHEAKEATKDEIRYHDLKFGPKLAEGTYGEVFHGQLCGVNVAIKVIKGQPNDSQIVASFKKEIDIMKSLRHPNIVEYLGACYAQNSKDKLTIVTEFYERGSLGHFLKKLHAEKKRPSEYFIVKTGLMVAQGLAWLHRKGVMHRDLKPENVLMDRGNNVRICDFGVSAGQFNSFQRKFNFYGTPVYAAPEVIDEAEYGVSSDIYSFGVLLVSMFKCGCPFDHNQFPKNDEDNSLLKKAVVSGLRPSIPKNASPEIANLVKRCFKAAASRPTADDLVQKLKNILKKMVLEEQDIISEASPAVQELFVQKEHGISTLSAQLDLADNTLKAELALKIAVNKENAELKRALHQMEKELAKTQKYLANAQKKLKKKGGSAAAASLSQTQKAPVKTQTAKAGSFKKDLAAAMFG